MTKTFLRALSIFLCGATLISCLAVFTSCGDKNDKVNEAVENMTVICKV